MSDQQALIDRLRQLFREYRKLMAETDLLGGDQLEALMNEMDGLEVQLEPNELQKLLDEMV